MTLTRYSVPALYPVSLVAQRYRPFPYVHKSSAVWCPVPIVFKVAQNFWMQSKRGNTELGLLCASLPSQPWQCYSDGRQKAELGWSFLWGGERNLVDWRGVIFFFFFSQAHRCCWILVSQHKVGARRGELFILWGQPLYLQPHQATARLILCVWCCCRFPAERLRTWAAQVRPRQVWVMH